MINIEFRRALSTHLQARLQQAKIYASDGALVATSFYSPSSSKLVTHHSYMWTLHSDRVDEFAHIMDCVKFKLPVS